MATKAQRNLSIFYTRRHFTVAGAKVAGTRSPASSKIGNLLVVASITKALTAPGGTRNLEKYNDSIAVSENLVLQILRRNNLDAATKLDFFKWCSLRPNFKHSIETYSQMFRSICYYNSHNHREDIFVLLNSMKHDGVSLNSATFKLLLDSFTRAGNFNSALELLEFMESDLENSNNNCLSPDVYNSVLIALVQKNQVSLALSIFLKLLETNDGNGNSIGISDAVACNVLLVGLKRANMRDEFKQVFDKLRGKKNIFPLDRWGYNICIHAFGCWGDLSSCLSLFKEMKERGSWFSPDLCTYNSLIHVLCLLGKVKDALVVWEELKGSSGLEPDVYTYRIVIQGCSKAYLINDAIKVFSEMQYNGIRPDTIIYNSLLDGLLKARKLKDACNLFQKMIEDDGVRASCWTYNILIDGLFKNGRALAACTLFCDLKKKSNNFVDGVTYSIVILHLCQEGRLDEALKLVEEMEARGFTVDLVTITSLLIAIYREGHWDYTERLVKHVRENNLVPIILRWKDSMEATMKAPQSREKDFTPIFPSNGNFGDILSLEDLTDPETDTALGVEDERDPWSSSPYMDLLASKASSQSHATRAFSLTGGKRVDTKGADSFDIDMVNTFLSIFLAKGKLSMACKLFEIFTDMGADPVSYTYNSMMGSFVKKGYFDQAWGVLEKMDKKVCPADVATYNVIIQGLGKMGRADLAGAVLDKLMKQGGYLDIVMYNTLINVLGKTGRIEEVNKLFQQMKDSGINPDVVTYNTLIEVHAKAGQLKQAYKFLRMMLEAGCAPNHVTDTTLDFLEKEIEKLRYQKASIKRPNVDNSL
ncbi:pentatricopeptide repeat-containing protein At4g01570-like [Nicotiana tabacum]|uniref:Pentatricopeptide repeat-containing protein At4g01570-like n=1 Tax=Nicotiana tabacum TaxID=4097 RepID=A0A1S4C944_TOBAC|nr:PREDICTED: pentatricopeptide repeat-containing protein At4g01570-like [Nicotiana tabacum]XP_016497763.1 PREDICTED: pentatricopeptide repeat-containing protein At4g01570-like [Nicotiana tabacum]